MTYVPDRCTTLAIREMRCALTGKLWSETGYPGQLAAAEPGPTEDLPRLRRRGRQDLRHAQRGPPAAGARHRRRCGLRRDARPGAHCRPAPRPGGCAPRPDPLPRHHLRGDGRRRRARPAAGDRVGRRVRALQRAGIAEREALAGRRGTARRRHRRHLHGQYPAPGVAQRRGREDHWRAAAGDRARRGRPRRRPGRAGRHDRRRRCGAGWRTATSTRPRRSTPR